MVSLKKSQMVLVRSKVRELNQEAIRKIQPRPERASPLPVYRPELLPHDADLASTAYYIGGIVENAIGPAAPWFILAVMLFSYAVRSIYIESCSLFVRGGVYRVVKEAMGGFLAKLSVSALMFDYILTGPISGVSAGQYIMGLLLDTLAMINPDLQLGPDAADTIRRWGAVVIACADHALLLPPEPAGHPRIERQGAEDHDRHHGHGGRDARLVRRRRWPCEGPVNRVPLAPDLRPKVEYADGARPRTG